MLWFLLISFMFSLTFFLGQFVVFPFSTVYMWFKVLCLRPRCPPPQQAPTFKVQLRYCANPVATAASAAVAKSTVYGHIRDATCIAIGLSITWRCRLSFRYSFSHKACIPALTPPCICLALNNCSSLVNMQSWFKMVDKQYGLRVLFYKYWCEARQ